MSGFKRRMLLAGVLSSLAFFGALAFGVTGTTPQQHGDAATWTQSATARS